MASRIMLRLPQSQRLVANAVVASRVTLIGPSRLSRVSAVRLYSSENNNEKKQRRGNDNQPRGEPGKSPFAVFLDTFKQEWSKNKELQDNIKALADETGKMSESEAYKRAKDAYEKAREGTSAASSRTGDTLKKAGKVVGSAAVHAWDSPVMKVTRHAAKESADAVAKATEPVRQTKIYKDVRDVIDDGSSIRYGGFEEKEKRRARRLREMERRMAEARKKGLSTTPIEENENAGTSLVAKDEEKSLKNTWSKYKESSPIFRKWEDFKVKLEESENPVISTVRTFSDKVSNIFAETETGRVVRMFKEMDPTFTQEAFLKEVREYILPEVLDAYVKGDADTLKLWLSEAPYSIWATSSKQHIDAGLMSAGRVLDIRGVDILSARILPPNDIPVFVIGARAQEVHMYKNIKTGEIAAGVADHIQMSTYAMVITRLPDEMKNEETRGYRILELVRGQTRDFT